jgi:hypothetical protein
MNAEQINAEIQKHKEAIKKLRKAARLMAKAEAAAKEIEPMKGEQCAG